jgi:AraC-like DNA-binding protein
MRLFAALVSLLSAIISSVAPALKASRTAINTDLKSESRGGMSGQAAQSAARRAGRRGNRHRVVSLDELDLIGEASFRVGYQSHSQFSKDCRKHFGCLPMHDVIAHVNDRVPVSAYSPGTSVRQRKSGPQQREGTL